ncbi:flagellar hook-length control protein FliK [Lysobacter sp. HA35]
MNVDRSSSPVQALTGAATHASSKAKQHDAPEFSFDTGEKPAAPVEARREMPREHAANEAKPREATRSHHDDAPRSDDATAARAKPSEHANAASRRDGKPRDDASTPESTDTTAAASTEASDDATKKTAPDDNAATTADSLPNRMLALLTGDWSAVSAKPAPATGDGAATALPGLPGATPLPAATAPVTGAIAASTDATASTTNTTSTPGAAAGVALMQALSPAADATNLQATPATPAADAFAALAALAQSKSDRTGSTSSVDASTPGAPGIAFNPLMARGTDMPSNVRDVIAASPLSVSLALDADFDDGMSQRITWMADQKLDHAEIRVTPDSLGPIDIRLQMDGHRVNATFHTAHADVRQALESGMDHLRTLLGKQGMELGQTQVGTGSRQGGDGRANGASGGFPGGSGLGSDAEEQVTTVRTLRSRGLIDEYV